MEEVVEVRLWICPRDGNYYGSESAGNLAEQGNASEVGKATGTRDKCPVCHLPRDYVVQKFMKVNDPKELSSGKSVDNWVWIPYNPTSLPFIGRRETSVPN